ncbi:DFFA factor, partial [Amia calva]|nr:DFFA factor [Amia calva]
GSEALGFTPGSAVSVRLEDDGTIVEDETYFLCLPANTKFMLLQDKEKWAPLTKFDGGTAWMSVDIDADIEGDVLDSGQPAAECWQDLARKLKQDLSSLILMSEADLQSLVKVPSAELAAELGYQESKMKTLQDRLQNVLDRREEDRQFKELLQLFLKAEHSESTRDPGQEDGTELMVVDAPKTVSKFSARTLMVLKGKTSPETRLSTSELQEVIREGSEQMSVVLGWDAVKTDNLLQACEEELKKRLEQVTAMQSLHSLSKHNMAKDNNGATPAKRPK